MSTADWKEFNALHYPQPGGHPAERPKAMMIWTATPNSATIDEVGYEAATRTMGVRFKPKGTKWPASEYHYSNVPAPIYRAMLAAPSVGHFFETEIKLRPDLYQYQKQGEYPFQRMQGEALPPKAENPDSALMKVDRMTAAEIFVPGAMDSILVAIREEVKRQAAEIDTSNPAGLKQLGSLAYKVTKSKTFIESQRKSLVAAEKKRLQAIDTEGRRIWDILEGIADEVRKPLTDFEQIEKDRRAANEYIITTLIEYAKVPFGASAQEIYATIERVNCLDTSDMQELAQLAEGHKANALKALRDALRDVEKAEAQKAENERLKAEAQERETQERAISAARWAREAAEKEAEAERQRLLADKQEAEDRAVAAERRAKQAVEEERARAAEAKAKEDEATAKREANKKHVAKIHREAEEALAAAGIGASERQAVIELIAAGKIPHISISY